MKILTKEDIVAKIKAAKTKYCFNTDHTIVKNWLNEREIEVDDEDIYKQFGDSEEYILIKILEI